MGEAIQAALAIGLFTEGARTAANSRSVLGRVNLAV